jgi:uncharacterized membrane protein
MSPTLQVVLLWAGFAGSHLILSSRAVRGSLVARLGENGFRGLYSLFAFAFFVPLVWTYFANKHDGPWLWTVPHGPLVRGIVYVGMGVAFVLLVASFLRPSPAAIIPGNPEPYGVYRITRHPLLMALVIFGLVHLLVNGAASDVAFFGGFVVFTLIGARHQDARKLAEGTPGFRRFWEATPLVPFTGRDTLRGLRELSPVALVLGIGATVVVRWFHAAWFGG